MPDGRKSVHLFVHSVMYRCLIFFDICHILQNFKKKLARLATHREGAPRLMDDSR